MQLIALGYLYRRTEDLVCQVFEPFAGISTVDEYMMHVGQFVVMGREHQQGAVEIFDFCG
jgi:hypothetical protein